MVQIGWCSKKDRKMIIEKKNPKKNRGVFRWKRKTLITTLDYREMKPWTITLEIVNVTDIITLGIHSPDALIHYILNASKPFAFFKWNYYMHSHWFLISFFLIKQTFVVMVDILSTVNSCKHLLLKFIKITHRITVEVLITLQLIISI